MPEPETKEPIVSLQRIVALNQLADRAEEDLKIAEADVRVKRKALDRAIETLRQAAREEALEKAKAEIASAPEPEGEATAEPKPEKKAKAKKADELVFDVPDDGLWRACHIEFLGASLMPPETVKAFEEHVHPVKSLGDLMSFVNKEGCKLTDIPGVTKARAKRIEDALFEFVRQSEEKVGAKK